MFNRRVSVVYVLLAGEWIVTVPYGIKLALATSTTCTPATNKIKSVEMIIAAETAFFISLILYCAKLLLVLPEEQNGSARETFLLVSFNHQPLGCFLL